MKRENLFRINIDRDDAVIDREEFILRRESTYTATERKALEDKLSKTVIRELVGVQRVLGSFTVLCLVAGIFCGAIMLFRYLVGGTASKELFCLAAFFLLLCAVFDVAQKVSLKKSAEGDTMQAIDAEFAHLYALSRQELMIPSDAKTVEIFGHFYDKDASPSDPYDIDEVAVFEENGQLCLHHVSTVIAVPIDSIEAVVGIEDTIVFNDWQKDEPYDSIEYREYHIQKEQISEYEERYSMQLYYSIRFAKDGTPFELLVPPYEIGTFLDILKLEVTWE